MRNTQATHPWLRILRDVMLFDLLIFLSVGVIYLLAGWTTPQQYGSGLLWAGIIGMILILATSGWRDGRRQENVTFSQLMRDHEAFYVLNSANSGRARFMVVGLIALVIAFAIGWILVVIP